jgi:hypothetical protein
MKNRCTAVLIALCVAASLAAQQVTDTSAVSLLNVGNYSKLFLHGGGRLDGQYSRAVSDNDYETIAPLGGSETRVDTPLEIALLSTCAGVVDVRPVEASNILGNPRQADLKLGAAVYQEMRILRFLGDSAAAGRHEGILQFITGRGNASGAEIEAYYRQHIGALIAAVVDAEFKDVTIAANTKTAIQQAISGFFLTPNQTNYNGLKRYKYQNGRLYDIEVTEYRVQNALESAELFEAAGNVAQAEFFRKSAESTQDFLNTMKAANAYISALRALHPVIADKVLQESR